MSSVVGHGTDARSGDAADRTPQCARVRHERSHLITQANERES